MLVGLRRAGRPLALMAVAAALVVVGTGCSDDDGNRSSERAAAETGTAGTTPSGSDQRSDEGSATTTSTVPRPVPLSKPAKRKGTSACAGKTPKAIVRQFLPQLKRSRTSDTAAVRRSLAMQVKQLQKARGATVPAPVAAAIYAVGKPRAQRSGAYQGCLQSLVEQVNE